MNKIRNYWRNKKGITLVWGAFFLVLCLMFLGLAADIAYMYVVKNQLQVAADAAALAGAAMLDGTNSTTQTEARAKAVEFAFKNSAAQSKVVLLSNGNNTLSNTNDITVGNWDRSKSPPYDPTRIPINAVQVFSRRTNETTDTMEGKFSLFIGKVFGWNLMSVQTSAIASRPPRAQLPVAICQDTCNPGVIQSSGTLLYWAPYPSEAIPGDIGIAWTSFKTDSQSMDKEIINNAICGSPYDICGKTVYTSNGYMNDTAKQLRCAFKNPLFDSESKICADGKCDNILDDVTSWNALVPVFISPNGCPPGDQPAPETVVQYAELTITEVYASGAGGTNDCACEAYNPPLMTGPTPNAIVATYINCVDCTSLNLLGKQPILVR